MSDVFWPGVVSMAVMYLAVFAVGVIASRRRKGGTHEKATIGDLLLAGRSLPLWVALVTMTATWVGGGYINGTAEWTYGSGILWGFQPGVGYAISLILGGLFFARTMRRHGFTTLVDPLESRYGRAGAAVLMVPAILGELFWSGAILVALGTTVGTIIGIDTTTSVLISSAIAIAYTVSGGLRSVAYTDVIQLGLIVLGLGVAIPFAVATAGGLDAIWTAAALDGGKRGALTLSGTAEAVSYADFTILLMLGGIPWNVYFQRVLASRDEHVAAKQSIAAGFLCAAMAIPAVIIGLCARAVDWSALAAGAAGESLGGAAGVQAELGAHPELVLPLMLRLAVPTWVAVLGLGAISAAVMSSVDSSILSASSLASWNGYRRLLRPEAGDREMKIVVRTFVVALGAAATTIALTVGSVKALWYLCGDVVYCLLFPQLAMALFDTKANRIGALAGLAVALLLRLGGGDETLGLPAFLDYPEMGGFDFPFRTLAMASGLTTAIVVSRLTGRLDAPRPLNGPATADAAAPAEAEKAPEDD